MVTGGSLNVLFFYVQETQNIGVVFGCRFGSVRRCRLRLCASFMLGVLCMYAEYWFVAVVWVSSFHVFFHYVRQWHPYNKYHFVMGFLFVVLLCGTFFLKLLNKLLT